MNRLFVINERQELLSIENEQNDADNDSSLQIANQLLDDTGIPTPKLRNILRKCNQAVKRTVIYSKKDKMFYIRKCK